ncbi:MAG: response regulator transcription factor [Burkholderiales bacterium]
MDVGLAIVALIVAGLLCFALYYYAPAMLGMQTRLQLYIVGTSTFGTVAHRARRCSDDARAMKAGAAEFLTKPFDEQVLLDAIHAAIERDRVRRRDVANLVELKARYAALTQREREVMTFVVAGRVNKQIAAELGLSLVTVKVHRGQVMRKMLARSVPELVRIADRLSLPDSA